MVLNLSSSGFEALAIHPFQTRMHKEIKTQAHIY
jgi:hypothetical protein